MTPRNEYSSAVRWNLAILVAVVVFALLAASNIDLPGVYADEVLQVTPALHFVKSGMESQAIGEAHP